MSVASRADRDGHAPAAPSGRGHNAASRTSPERPQGDRSHGHPSKRSPARRHRCVSRAWRRRSTVTFGRRRSLLYVARLREQVGGVAAAAPQLVILPRDDAGRVLLLSPEILPGHDETSDVAWFRLSALANVDLKPVDRYLLWAVLPDRNYSLIT
jgi:hypothetical protein